MTTTNGFPQIRVHELTDIWKLGNMALGWARSPLALDGPQLEMFIDLCRRYGLEPAEVLMRYQQIAFPDLLQQKLEASRERARGMPDVSGGGVPYPPRQDVSDSLSGPQTAVLPPILGSPTHVDPAEYSDPPEVAYERRQDDEELDAFLQEPLTSKNPEEDN